MLKFQEQGHRYWSDDNTEWISVTSLVHKFIEPFDAETQAPKSSRNKKSKWYGVPVKDIIAAWDTERDRAAELGTWYHKTREDALCDPAYRAIHTVHLPQVQDGIKLSLSQKLEEGIYPEFLCYLPSAGICGQSDKVEVRDGKIHITDYKTSKEIKMNSFVNYEGVSKKMLAPLSHLEDCEYSHYCLQLSIYMYILLRHNPNLVPGDMIIEHVIFEEESQDKWGYPIYKKDTNGDFIVKEIKQIPLKYMKNEVNTIINWLKAKKK